MTLLWLKNANMAHIFFRKFVGNKNSPYFCSVFFMVLDLRLTRLVVVRQSIFFVFTPIFCPFLGLQRWVAKVLKRQNFDAFFDRFV